MKGGLLFMIMAQMLAGSLPGSRSRGRDELEGIDIRKEAELIKQKKSDLTARQRDIVMYRYERILEEAANSEK